MPPSRSLLGESKECQKENKNEITFSRGYHY